MKSICWIPHLKGGGLKILSQQAFRVSQRTASICWSQKSGIHLIKLLTKFDPLFFSSADPSPPAPSFFLSGPSPPPHPNFFSLGGTPPHPFTFFNGIALGGYLELQQFFFTKDRVAKATTDRGSKGVLAGHGTQTTDDCAVRIVITEGFQLGLISDPRVSTDWRILRGESPDHDFWDIAAHLIMDHI